MNRKWMKRRLVILLGLSLWLQARAQILITRQFEVSTVIPDGGELVDARTLAVGGSSIASLEVGLNISAVTPGDGFNGDLFARVSHQGSSAAIDATAVLLNRVGQETSRPFGYSDGKGLNVTFSDAGQDIHSYQNSAGSFSGPLTGVWAPDGRAANPDTVTGATPRTAPLSAFTGKEASGRYILHLADMVGGNEHRLDSWSVTIHTTPDASSPLNLAGDTVSADSSSRTVANPLSVTGQVHFAGTHAITFTGEATLATDGHFVVDNQVELAGSLRQNGESRGLIKEGAGTLVISGNANLTGHTVVKEGDLRVNGHLGGSAVTVERDAILSGSGTVGSVTLEEGGSVSPGNSPGILHTTGNVVWAGGANYVWQINKLTAGAGADPGWDFWDISGSLEIRADSASPFKLKLQTLTLENAAGPLSGFDATHSRTWAIAAAHDDVTNFDPTAFMVDTSGFQNDLQGGSFGVVLAGDELRLVFTPVPEPQEYAAWAAASLAAFAVLRKHRQRKATGRAN